MMVGDDNYDDVNGDDITLDLWRLLLADCLSGMSKVEEGERGRESADSVIMILISHNAKVHHIQIKATQYCQIYFPKKLYFSTKSICSMICFKECSNSCTQSFSYPLCPWQWRPILERLFARENVFDNLAKFRSLSDASASPSPPKARLRGGPCLQIRKVWIFDWQQVLKLSLTFTSKLPNDLISELSYRTHQGNLTHV